MIDIRAALRDVLLGDATVSGLVGASRVYPGVLPQGVKSASLVQNLISEVTDYHMAGPSGLASIRVQLDAWAQTQDEAVALANAAKERLSGFSGLVSFGSNSPLDEVVIQVIFADSARDDYDPTPKLYRRTRDYLIWYEEA